MGLSIKHVETERMVRELAERRAQSMTRVIHDLAAEALRREGPSETERQAYMDRATAFLEDLHKRLPPGPYPSDKEMDGWIYDEDGDPSR